MKIFNLKYAITLSAVLLLFASCTQQGEKKIDEGQSKVASKLNPEIEQKITDLLSKMTLQAKVGQMCQVTLDVMMKRDSADKIIEPNVLDPERVKKVLVDHQVGSILNVGYHTFNRDKWYEIIDEIQTTAIGKTRFNIPVIYGIDAIHGVTYTEGGTLFPQEIGLAATWNKECARDLGSVTAYETRASGISWNFSPVLDLGRQPLWSRFFETLGEDVYLSKTIGTEIIKGYQGDNTANKDKVVSCLKHFVGYSNPASGRDRTPAWIPERMMEEFYLPAFKAGVDAGALTVMVNSGEVNGIPGHANYHLLTEVLKERWGFIGFAVSDWEDMIMLNTIAEIEPTYKDAIKTAVNAGVDMSMVPYSPFYEKFCINLVELVNDGEVSIERIDDAVRRILRVKYMSGLFENTHFSKDDYPMFGDDSSVKKSYQAASESMTLLKNQDALLPLSKKAKVLVVGPTANSLNCLNGAWTHTWQGVDPNYNTKGKLTIVEAIRAKIGDANVDYIEGVRLGQENNWEVNEVIDLNKVQGLASKNDAIIVCLGELPGTERPGDIKSLNLPKAQQELVEQAYKSNKPVILVLVEGHPKILNAVEPKANAIIQAYLPGNEGGVALADVLFGDVNPSGKLPYAYPRYDGVIEHYDHKYSEDVGGKSKDFDAYNPQWDFGFGLSYTSFEYSDITLSNTSITKDDELTVAVTVTNTGEVEGKEVVQLYLRDKIASISPARKKLKAFDKISLEAGESKTVEFTLSNADLQFVGLDNKWVSEAGEFVVLIAGKSEEFELVASK